MRLKALHGIVPIVGFYLVLSGASISEVSGDTTSDPFLEGWAAYENKDFASAFNLWRPLANDGNPDAQYLLGILFANGLGVPVNFKIAAEWFHKSARQGDVGAQFFLGLLFETGKGRPMDLSQAGYWFKKAAGQGYPDAQKHLGIWYADGKGGEPDYFHAYVWLALARANGIQTVETEFQNVKDQLTLEELKKARQLAQKLWERLEER